MLKIGNRLTRNDDGPYGVLKGEKARVVKIDGSDIFLKLDSGKAIGTRMA